MADTVKIFCENGGSSLHVSMGTTLRDVVKMLSLGDDHSYIAAYVNNNIKELDYKIFEPINVRFINLTHFEGIRVYQRTLFFILQKASADLFPGRKLRIKHSVAKGFYCEFDGIEDVPLSEIDSLRTRMQELVESNIPIVQEVVTSQEAEQMYSRLGLDDKISLIRTRPRLYVTVYHLADQAGYFFGALAPSTGYINLFGINKYFGGFLLTTPRRSNPSTLESMIPQNKMFDVFSEYKRWVDVIGVANIGALNSFVLDHKGGELIKIAEAFHEKKLASIADTIAERHANGQAKIVLISGPSSSGKTTFAKRLGIELRVLGLHPVLISLDDYFVERERTPRDENGEYDYEALEAIDIEAFNADIKRLLAGERVEIPRYDFITGKRQYAEKTLQLDPSSVLVIEGIHGLNPNLTPHIPRELKTCIYISAFTSISMDNLTRIPTTDNRLIRRMVRDYRTRGASATDTLHRWESVRRGEDKYIFPNQEQADIMFNSSLFYEIAVLKSHVEPLLHEVPNTVPEYGEARRLLKFLDNFTPLHTDEIPPTSILREFIGGSSFSY